MKSVRWVPLWVAPAVFILAIATVWLRLQIVRTTYAIDQSDRILAGLAQAKEQSEIKLASLRSPRRLEALARSRFYLGQPKADHVITLSTKAQTDE